MLWFDVEKRYNTTKALPIRKPIMLWFDVEKRYNTTALEVQNSLYGCGLM